MFALYFASDLYYDYPIFNVIVLIFWAIIIWHLCKSPGKTYPKMPGEEAIEYNDYFAYDPSWDDGWRK